MENTLYWLKEIVVAIGWIILAWVVLPVAVFVVILGPITFIYMAVLHGNLQGWLALWSL